jgi:thioredoxin 1
MTCVKITLIHNFEKFKEIINSNKYNLFMFSAPWCGPCNNVFPLFEKLSLSFSTIGFYKVDIEDCDTQIEDFVSVKVLPTFILYKSGSHIKEFQGGDMDKITKNLESITQQ